MKTYTQISLVFSLFLFSGFNSLSQSCGEIVDVSFDYTYNGMMYWQYQEGGCPLIEFEVRDPYGYTFYTGPDDFTYVPSGIYAVEVRAVCDCSGYGGSVVEYTDWYYADVPCNPYYLYYGYNATTCSDAQQLIVESFNSCGSITNNPFYLNPFAFSTPLASCLEYEYYYSRFSHFTAPETGSIDLSLSGDIFNAFDSHHHGNHLFQINAFGFALREADCGQEISCYPEVSSGVVTTLDGLTPGLEYGLELWPTDPYPGDYPYYYGSCYLEIARMEVSICESEALTGCPEDITGNGVVDIDDFIQFNSAFGNNCSDCPEDITGDGVVDIDDFLQFNSAFGVVC